MKNVYLLLASIALMVFFQKEASACECWNLPMSPEQSIGERLNRNKAVFSGEVVGISKSSMTQAIIRGGKEIPILLIKIKVAESWKEILSEEITITTFLGDCGYPFQIGKKYLVFAYAIDKNNLRTGPCSENKEIEKASEELKILGKGKKTQKIFQDGWQIPRTTTIIDSFKLF